MACDMTSSPTPAVLPDTRALNTDEARLALWQAIGSIKIGNPTDDKLIVAELAKRGVYLAKLTDQPSLDTPLLPVTDAKGFITLHEPNEDGDPGDIVASVWRDDWLDRLTATPPARAAAVPAGEATDAMIRAANEAAENGGGFQEVWSAMTAAAPKVASDTGAKLSDDDAIIAEFAFLYREYGLADDATLARDAIGLKRKVLAALATDTTDGAAGGGEEKPFAYFQRNEGWDMWEQVADEYAQADPGIVAAYRHPATTPGGDLLEQVVAIVNEEGPQNPESDWTNYARTRATMRDAILKRLRALSARNQTDDGGEKA